MSVASLPSETVAQMQEGGLGRLRVGGGVRARFSVRDGATYAATLGERDGYRMRFPRGDDGLEGVVINTGGGVAGGDRVAFAMDAGPGADVVIATQSAERVYRALGESTSAVDVALTVADRARLVWMPQETILFNGARLSRSFTVDLASRARLLMVEMLVLGRKAHGECMRAGALRDVWRVRREGRLVFADNVSLEGDVAAAMGRPAVGDGAHVTATLLFVSPDAEERLERAREALAPSTCRIAAGAWDGMLVARGLGQDVAAMRAVFARLATMLSGRARPRVWQ